MKNNNNYEKLVEFVFVFIRARKQNIEVTMQKEQDQEYFQECYIYRKQTVESILCVSENAGSNEWCALL